MSSNLTGTTDCGGSFCGNLHKATCTWTVLLESEKNPEVQYRKLKEEGKDIPKFYLAIGTDDDLLDANRDFVSFLEKEGADYIYEEGPGKHDWYFWNEYLDRGLKAVL